MDHDLVKKTSDNSLGNVSRSSRGMNANFSALNSSSGAGFETAEGFRKGMESYSIKNDSVSRSNFDEARYGHHGGVPMDWDKSNGQVFLDITDGHTLLVGATGSKKSRLFAMPMARILGASGESMVICDPKAEIYKRTADVLRRKHGYKIGVINLRDPLSGDSWNILSIPYHQFLNGETDKACEFINDLTVNLIPIQSEKDPYWDYSSRDLLFGLVLLLFQLCKDKELPDSLVNISSVLCLKGQLFRSTRTSDIKSGELWKYADGYPAVRSRLLGTVICPSDTMSCILSVFDQHMSCFSLQPKLTDMLSSNSLPIDSLGFEPTAVFLVMPDEKTTYHKVITVLVKQIYEYLIDQAFRKCSDNMYPVRINFLMDEFSSLPAIPDFPQMITASRSRNIRFTLIVQSKHQLLQRYDDEAETIQSNCANWLFLFSREASLLKEISELGGVNGNRPLISVDRLQRLNKDEGECLAFSGRRRPYIAHLPDISEYDKDAFDAAEFIPSFTPSKEPWPSFDKLFPNHAEHRKPFPSPRRNDRLDDIDISRMIKDIDKKIAELKMEDAQNSEGRAGSENE